MPAEWMNLRRVEDSGNMRRKQTQRGRLRKTQSCPPMNRRRFQAKFLFLMILLGLAAAIGKTATEILIFIDLADNASTEFEIICEGRPEQ
jgi:hypothetical protein